MRTFVLILQVLACIGLIVTVLLQSGKTAGLGSIAGGAEALFGGNKKGMDELFKKLAVACAVGFIILTIILSVI